MKELLLLDLKSAQKCAIILLVFTIFGCQPEKVEWQVETNDDQSISITSPQMQLEVAAEGIEIQNESTSLTWKNVGAQAVEPKQVEDKVVYDDIHPGIDLHFYHKGQGQTAYDYILAPGADVKDIQVALPAEHGEGYVNGRGDFILPLADGVMRHTKPYSYQEIDGAQVEVASNFVYDEGQLGFELGSYDRDYAVVIDPTIMFATPQTVVTQVGDTLFIEFMIEGTSTDADLTVDFLTSPDRYEITESNLVDVDDNSLLNPSGNNMATATVEASTIKRLVITTDSGSDMVIVKGVQPDALTSGLNVATADGADMLVFQEIVDMGDGDLIIPAANGVEKIVVQGDINYVDGDITLEALDLVELENGSNIQSIGGNANGNVLLKANDAGNSSASMMGVVVDGLIKSNRGDIDIASKASSSYNGSAILIDENGEVRSGTDNSDIGIAGSGTDVVGNAGVTIEGTVRAERQGNIDIMGSASGDAIGVSIQGPNGRVLSGKVNSTTTITGLTTGSSDAVELQTGGLIQKNGADINILGSANTSSGVNLSGSVFSQEGSGDITVDG
ncbi:MAG: hypothetical protein AAF223_06765, partial [Bacteroidota bacterium]